MTQRVKRAERLRRQRERSGYVPIKIQHEHKLCACGHASYECATHCCVCKADIRDVPRSPGHAALVNQRRLRERNALRSGTNGDCIVIKIGPTVSS